MACGAPVPWSKYTTTCTLLNSGLSSGWFLSWAQAHSISTLNETRKLIGNNLYLFIFISLSTYNIFWKIFYLFPNFLNSHSIPFLHSFTIMNFLQFVNFCSNLLFYIFLSSFLFSTIICFILVFYPSFFFSLSPSFSFPVLDQSFLYKIKMRRMPPFQKKSKTFQEFLKNF